MAMNFMKQVTVVLPCLNEEQSLWSLLQAIPQGVSEVIVVDNASTDNTSNIAKSFGAYVIPQARRGYGIALKTGLTHAKSEIVICLDGDGQYPVLMIPEIVEHMEKYRLDFISCSRFPLKIKGSMNLFRQTGNKMLTYAANVLFGLRLRDSQSGMLVMRKIVLQNIYLQRDDMAFSEEIKIKVATNPQFRFAEYHIPYYPRRGHSKLIPWKHGVCNLLFLVQLRLQMRKDSLSV